MFISQPGPRIKTRESFLRPGFPQSSSNDDDINDDSSSNNDVCKKLMTCHRIGGVASRPGCKLELGLNAKEAECHRLVGVLQ